MNTLGATAF